MTLRNHPQAERARSMSDKTFMSGGKTYNITVYPGPDSTKTYPILLLVHGNGAFRPPFGKQIRDFAESLAKLGYVTAVPGYYVKDIPPELDTEPAPHVPTLAAAVAMVGARKDVDPVRLGLIGYSLGAAVAMRYIASDPPKKVKVLADFFGPVDATITGAAGKFPPTIIFQARQTRARRELPGARQGPHGRPLFCAALHRAWAAVSAPFQTGRLRGHRFPKEDDRVVHQAPPPHQTVRGGLR
jgi:dienelactone hydrolase